MDRWDRPAKSQVLGSAGDTSLVHKADSYLGNHAFAHRAVTLMQTRNTPHKTHEISKEEEGKRKDKAASDSLSSIGGLHLERKQVASVEESSNYFGTGCGISYL